MKRLIIFCRGSSTTLSVAALICISFLSHAQSLKRECIASVGTGTLVNSTIIKQAVGQPYSTLTYYSGGLGFRPGFLQPASLSGAGSSEVNQTLWVYPNPASNSFSIHSPDFSSGFFQARTLSGQTILEKDFSAEQNNFNCQNWPTGLYILTIYAKGHAPLSSKLVINK